MTDHYIDLFEVGEYGDHFVKNSTQLDGLSPLVDVPALRAKVQAKVDAVNTELANAGIRRGDLRAGRGSTATAAAEGKELIQRFYHSLLGLPPSSGVDVAAFFPGKLLGDVTNLKSDDVKARLGSLVQGFDTAANKAAAASLGTWQKDLAAARDNLAAAVTDKGGSLVTSIAGTAALRAARESFLHVYNKVAKKLVAGLLADVGREAEYHLFFKDLTVNEGGKAPKKAAPPNEGAGAGEPTQP